MKRYASKLLLFGEYTIINGSRALAVPYAPYAGAWQFAATPDPRLQYFADYLETASGMAVELDVATFREEVQQGLIFESNIPIGYGLGSSGALCAAVYERYAREPVDREDQEQFAALRRQLAAMESHFHGSSSGTDPLICYLQYPVLIHPQSGIRRAELPSLQHLSFSIFLLDTRMSRSTGPLVEHYLEQCRDTDFDGLVRSALMPAVDRLIDNFLGADWLAFQHAFREVSTFQLAHFPRMIPEPLRPWWQAGLQSGQYTLKLCGAGGGGFLLGISSAATIPAELEAAYPIIKVW